MLARYFHKMMHLQLDKGAVRSLEYAMIVMVVVVASLGAVGVTGQSVAANAPSAPALMQLASEK